MIGKPDAGKLHVRFDEGGQDFFLRMTLNGHEAGNGGYGQGLAPKGSRACPLLYPNPFSPIVLGSVKSGAFSPISTAEATLAPPSTPMINIPDKNRFFVRFANIMHPPFSIG